MPITKKYIQDNSGILVGLGFFGVLGAMWLSNYNISKKQHNQTTEIVQAINDSGNRQSSQVINAIDNLANTIRSNSPYQLPANSSQQQIPNIQNPQSPAYQPINPIVSGNPLPQTNSPSIVAHQSGKKGKKQRNTSLSVSTNSLPSEVTKTNYVTQTITHHETVFDWKVKYLEMPKPEKAKLEKQVSELRDSLSSSKKEIKGLESKLNTSENLSLSFSNKLYQASQKIDVLQVSLSQAYEGFTKGSNDLYTTNLKLNSITKVNEALLADARRSPPDTEEKEAVKKIVANMALFSGDYVVSVISTNKIERTIKLTYPSPSKTRTIENIESLNEYVKSIAPYIIYGPVEDANSRTFDDFATRLGIKQSIISKIDPETKVSLFDYMARYQNLYGENTLNNLPVIITSDRNGETAIIGEERAVNKLVKEGTK